MEVGDNKDNIDNDEQLPKPKLETLRNDMGDSSSCIIEAGVNDMYCIGLQAGLRSCEISDSIQPEDEGDGLDFMDIIMIDTDINIKLEDIIAEVSAEGKDDFEILNKLDFSFPSSSGDGGTSSFQIPVPWIVKNEPIEVEESFDLVSRCQMHRDNNKHEGTPKADLPIDAKRKCLTLYRMDCMLESHGLGRRGKLEQSQGFGVVIFFRRDWSLAHSSTG